MKKMFGLTLPALLLALGSFCQEAPRQHGKCTFAGFNDRRVGKVEITRRGQNSPYLVVHPDSEGQVTFTLPGGADCSEFEANSSGVRGKRIN